LVVGNYGRGTMRNYMCEMRLLFQYYHQKEVEDITQSDINGYIVYVKTVHGVGYAKCRSLAHSCSFFYKKVIQKPFILPTTLYPRKEFKLPKVMSEAEATQLFSVDHPILTQAILGLLYGCGLRISEVRDLKISDIETANSRIKICQAKGKKDRYVLLPKRLLIKLRHYYQSLSNPSKIYLFASPQSGNRYHCRSMQILVNSAMKRAGLESKHYTSHTLRHSFATHMLDQGAKLPAIKELLGHSKLETTMIYLHLQVKTRAELVSPLDRLSCQD
jgi:integrase/recombinase XerD